MADREDTIDSDAPLGIITPTGQTHCVCPNGLTAVARFQTLFRVQIPPRHQEQK